MTPYIAPEPSHRDKMRQQGRVARGWWRFCLGDRNNQEQFQATQERNERQRRELPATETPQQ